jgi:drug/metabolite transporter (DMT)-like permease
MVHSPLSFIPYSTFLTLLSSSAPLFLFRKTSAIFYTIRKYGPIVFTVIMTTRQMLSIVLSTILFGHHIGLESLMGATVVFLSVFHSIHRQVRDSKEKKATKSLPRPPSTTALAETELAPTTGGSK